MRNEAVSTVARALTDAATSGRHAGQTYTTASAAAEKTPLFTGLSAPPVGKCVVRFRTQSGGQVHFHIEASDAISGVADCSVLNGYRLDGYYGTGYVDFQVDPRIHTHIDCIGGAGSTISWHIVSDENQSHPGG